MRTQDELLRAFRVSPPAAQRYIVRQLERLPVAYDTGDVADALELERMRTAQELKEQITACLGTLVPRILRQQALVGREEKRSKASLWTLHQIRVEDLAREIEAMPDSQDASLAIDASLEGLYKAGLQQLSDCLDALYRAPDSENQLKREEALHQLGRCPTRRSLATLGRFALSEGLAAQAALSLARLENSEADGLVVQAAAKAIETGQPGVIVALRDRPSAEARGLIERAASSRSLEFRRSAAIALEGLGKQKPLPILEKLAADPDDWTCIHALDSLGGLRLPEGIGIVQDAYRRSEHPFIRMVALKTAANLTCEKSVQLCLESIQGQDVDMVKAMAIEALVRLGAPRERFAKFSGLLSGADSVKLNSNLILALGGTERDSVNRTLKAMLGSPNELARAEAAFCLGYMEDPAALKLLLKLVDKDLSDIVRGQALHGLFRHRDRPEGREAILALLGHASAEVRYQVSRMLGEKVLLQDASTLERAASILRQEPDPQVRKCLMELLATRSGPEVKELIGEALGSDDPDLLAGALDASARLGYGELADRAQEHLSSPEVRIRARAARALWLMGDARGASALHEMLNAPYFETFQQAGRVLGEILCDLALIEKRDAGRPLFKFLQETMKTPGYAAFSRSESAELLAPDAPLQERSEDFDYSSVKGDNLLKGPAQEGEAMLEKLDRMFDSGEAGMPNLVTRNSEFRDFTLMQTDGISMGTPVCTVDPDKANIRTLYRRAQAGDVEAEAQLTELTVHGDPKVREAASKLLARIKEDRALQPSTERPDLAIPEEPYEITLETLLSEAVKIEASDVHLSVGYPPIYRVFGSMERSRFPVLTAANTRHLVRHVVTREKFSIFESDKDFDFSFSIDEVGSFRGNAFQELHGPGVVLRVVPSKIPTFDELGTPPILRTLCLEEKGLVLITGPTGSGKSTTMAAMLSFINQNRSCHIVTIEDPIEFVHESINCKFIQREVPTHATSFSRALRAALREDPDVIMVGELRDLETMELAIAAAETGHLVLSTLHTISAALTVDRVINVFPPEQQEQIRRSISESMIGVISQALLPRSDRPGRVAAYECLLRNPAIGNLIRENKLHQIPNVMLGCKKEGMVLMDDHLQSLVGRGIISWETAQARAVMKKEFAERFHGRAGAKR